MDSSRFFQRFLFFFAKRGFITHPLFLKTDIQEIRPTVFGPVPFICNAIYQMYKAKLEEWKQKEVSSEEKTLKERKEKEKEEEEREESREEREVKRKFEDEIKKEFQNILGNRLSSIKVTSAPCSSEIVEFLRDALQICVNEGYGSTGFLLSDYSFVCLTKLFLIIQRKEVGSISLNGVVTQAVKLRSIPELGFNITADPPTGLCVFNENELRIT